MSEDRVATLPKDAFVVYLTKAEEAHEVMHSCLRERKFNSAAGEAIQSVISSCDALTVCHLGKRSTAPSHFAVLGLMEDIRLEGMRKVREQVRDVLERKTLVQYEPRLIAEGDARRVCLQASRVFDWVVAHTAP